MANGLLTALTGELKNKKKFLGRSLAFLFREKPPNYNACIDKIMDLGQLLVINQIY